MAHIGHRVMISVAETANFLQQAGVATAMSDTAWDTSAILSDSSLFGRVLHTLIGYADQPSVLQVVVYAIVVTTIFALFKAFAPKAPAMRTRKPATAG